MWYIMKATHLSIRALPIGDVIKDNKGYDTTIFAAVTKGGRKMFISSAMTTGVEVGTVCPWTNDTGLGHRRPPYDHATFTIENVIHVANDGTISKANDVGFDIHDRRGVWVCK